MEAEFFIERTDNLQAANFSLMKDNSSLQISLIVSLLSESIKNQQPITRDDIISLYVTWKFTNREYVYIDRSVMIDGKWDYGRRKTTKQEFKEHYSTLSKSKTWFKSNLGAAIIKGRLLVIPIIEI